MAHVDGFTMDDAIQSVLLSLAAFTGAAQIQDQHVRWGEEPAGHLDAADAAGNGQLAAVQPAESGGKGAAKGAMRNDNRPPGGGDVAPVRMSAQEEVGPVQ